MKEFRFSRKDINSFGTFQEIVVCAEDEVEAYNVCLEMVYSDKQYKEWDWAWSKSNTEDMIWPPIEVLDIHVVDEHCAHERKGVIQSVFYNDDGEIDVG